jgi:hypothetical protein
MHRYVRPQAARFESLARSLQGPHRIHCTKMQYREHELVALCLVGRVT